MSWLLFTCFSYFASQVPSRSTEFLWDVWIRPTWLVHQPKSISPVLMWITLMTSTFQRKPQKRRAREKANSLSQTRRWVFNLNICWRFVLLCSLLLLSDLFFLFLIAGEKGVTSAEERWPENSGRCIDKSYWERSRLEDLSWCQVFSQGRCEATRTRLLVWRKEGCYACIL